MSLYFSVAVWSSLALCVLYAFAGHFSLLRVDATLASWLLN